MLDNLAAGAMNHLLRDANWARERLAPFAGASVRFVLPPLSSMFSIAEDGTLHVAPVDTQPVATIKLTPATAMRLLVLKDESARADVEVEGDAALAGAITRVLGTLRWDVEEDLSRLIGDIAAHRVVKTGQAVAHWQRAAGENLARSLGEYVTEERPLVAGREALRAFAQAVDELRDDTERLEKRIERLVRELSPREPG
jgi:ubiquinone biosynthesis accessory factor UbiJ